MEAIAVILLTIFVINILVAIYAVSFNETRTTDALNSVLGVTFSVLAVILAILVL